MLEFLKHKTIMVGDRNCSRHIQGTQTPSLHPLLPRLGPAPLPCPSCTGVRYCAPHCRRAGRPAHLLECGLPDLHDGFLARHGMARSSHWHRLALRLIAQVTGYS